MTVTSIPAVSNCIAAVCLSTCGVTVLVARLVLTISMSLVIDALNSVTELNFRLTRRNTMADQRPTTRAKQPMMTSWTSTNPTVDLRILWWPGPGSNRRPSAFQAD